MAPYPDSPGHKTGGTSRAAARRIAPRATALRDRVYAFLQANYPASFTADEVADRLGASILSVRPRVTEFLRGNLIEPSGERRLNASGMFASCWRAIVTGGQT
jgi:hypothetical protein